MLRIRLRRVGKKGKPSYRIVVADATAPRDGAYIEWIGNYDPMADPPVITLKEERAIQWLQKGAQPSDAVLRILDKNGILQRTPLYNTATTKKAETAAADAPTVSVVAASEPVAVEEQAADLEAAVAVAEEPAEVVEEATAELEETAAEAEEPAEVAEEATAELEETAAEAEEPAEVVEEATAELEETAAEAEEETEEVEETAAEAEEPTEEAEAPSAESEESAAEEEQADPPEIETSNDESPDEAPKE